MRFCREYREAHPYPIGLGETGLASWARPGSLGLAGPTDAKPHAMTRHLDVSDYALSLRGAKVGVLCGGGEFCTMRADIAEFGKFCVTTHA